MDQQMLMQPVGAMELTAVDGGMMSRAQFDPTTPTGPQGSVPGGGGDGAVIAAVFAPVVVALIATLFA